MHDRAEGLRTDDFDHDVNMVRHEAPREQPIAISIKMQQGILDWRSDFRLPQPTFSEPDIELLLNAMNSRLTMFQYVDNGRG